MDDDFDRAQRWNPATTGPPRVNLSKPNRADVSQPPNASVNLHKHGQPAQTPRQNVNLQKQAPPNRQSPAFDFPTTVLGDPPRPFDPQPWAEPQDLPSTRPRATRIVGVVAGVAGVVLIGVLLGNYLSDSSPARAPGSATSSGSSGGGSAESVGVQRCNAAPDVEVTSVTMSNSGLAVKTELTAKCADGDVVTDPSFGLAISDGTSDVAAGTFDTQQNPILIPPGGSAERVFVFPEGSYWRTPDILPSGGSGLEVLSTSSSADVGTSGATTDGATTLTASGQLSPTHGSPDDAALTALADLATADRGYIRQNLADWWIPQISSKRTGLVAEGMTWTPGDILREHLALRQRYGDVRLIWSGDWQTFSGPDWWVTVVGDPSSGPDLALNWCVSARLDVDHCYAKVVSANRGPEGTTALQKR